MAPQLRYSLWRGPVLAAASAHVFWLRHGGRHGFLGAPILESQSARQLSAAISLELFGRFTHLKRRFPALRLARRSCLALDFGEDITAWSVPHLILLASFVLTQLLALVFHVSTLWRQKWHTIFNLRLSDSLSLLILASILLLWLQLMLIDWDATLAGVRLEWFGIYRPEWLLAANLMACVTFTGVIGTRVVRCAGAATAAGLLALAIRYGLIQLFEADMLQYVAWIAALLPYSLSTSGHSIAARSASDCRNGRGPPSPSSSPWRSMRR